MKHAAPLAYGPNTIDPLIPPAIAAAEIGVSTDTLRRAWRRKDIEVIRVSKRRLGIRRSELARYLNERVVK